MKKLLFVSTRFLFPVDSGGKIRTTQILRGLKGGAYEVTLVSPATTDEVDQWHDEVATVCDDFKPWPAEPRGRFFNFWRLRYLLEDTPIPIRTDYSDAARDHIIEVFKRSEFDVVVIDFLHGSILLSEALNAPRVLFTHNVESEIFARHIEYASNAVMRWLWRSQHRKMMRFEKQELAKYQAVVAVSDRDKAQFEDQFSAANVQVIPTGVDLDFFTYTQPLQAELIFIGSMDWLPNQDAIRYFGEEIWPQLAELKPDLKLTVVGRAPPEDLIDMARSRGFNWEFTGFVDDIRDYTRGKAISILPIRIGGGTRLKAYESMANGSVMVSTTIGVEGLPINADEHYLRADSPDAFVQATVALLDDEARRVRIARAAREYVEQNFSYQSAARVFERICTDAMTQS